MPAFFAHVMELQHHEPGSLTSVAPTKYEQSVVDDKEAAQSVALSKEEDPFGDESHAQVRYRTMTWW